ncbi:MAG: putA [Chlamydiales bacterium]|jgi:RHH-type proline utilization regulon transcriptional repressor/proline dehydrogenase/delta 1-pyrroline-5-carboxylate dehydrogenase|nr:putA [Chlamydiales bacterium]
MDEPQELLEAKQMLQSVQGIPLSLEDRSASATKLAALLLKAANQLQTSADRRHLSEIERMMEDPKGLLFTNSLTDEAFRSHNTKRVADQISFLIEKYGKPRFLNFFKRESLSLFRWFGRSLSFFLVPLLRHLIRKQTAKVILPGEEKALLSHIQKRKKESIRVNLNHLGEAILGEEEALRRLNIYKQDLTKPDIDYVSIKISTIYSQINLVAWDETLEKLKERLRELYRAAIANPVLKNGKSTPKFVNLDMEEYRDLHLTCDLFTSLLSEPEFKNLPAGIVLQAYLPDSHLLQKQLTEWAIERTRQGGAPIKIRIVKGANLAMEKFESSLKGWPQAPYLSKQEVDANYKRMVLYGLKKEHAAAANIGVASHNLFDIAFALLLIFENQVAADVSFEMLEGMADHMRQAVQACIGEMLLYCPLATKEEFHNAVAYLMRRLDENTGPENFLRHIFHLDPGSKVWEEQSQFFSQSVQMAQDAKIGPYRTQNRFQIERLAEDTPFQNEADTDWALAINRKWVDSLYTQAKELSSFDIPLVIAGEEVFRDKKGEGRNPSSPSAPFYRYSLGNSADVERALDASEQAFKDWKETSVETRQSLIKQVASLLRERRGLLISLMIADGGKIASEADNEISEAIDFCEYYARNLHSWVSFEEISLAPKGPGLVTPPWNFPCSIPVGCISALLVTGNTVLFKPALETALIGYYIAQIFWEAGIPKNVLQFLLVADNPEGSLLIKDPRIQTIVLTGGTATAELFLQMRPTLDLIAETGGKNGMVITDLSDRDLAIKDIIHSAFSHSGQKCSACSLLILEEEVYEDAHFFQQLKDAAKSLKVGSCLEKSTKIGPLIRPAEGSLLRALTTLDPGEEWVLEPCQDAENPQLWSPGIKKGVVKGSFSHQTEFFGPVLSIMKAKDLAEAIELQNSTPYGLTGGIHSLDEREQAAWLSSIQVGNAYINRTITGAIVRRQPFGGWKNSGFGRGSKAGGPNYLLQYLKVEECESNVTSSQKRCATLSLLEEVGKSSGIISHETQAEWEKAIDSYLFWWQFYFSQEIDESQVLGQDNVLSYRPLKDITLLVDSQDRPLDWLKAIAASLIAGTPIKIAGSKEALNHLKAFYLENKLSSIEVIVAEEAELIEQLKKKRNQRLRILSSPSEKLLAAAASSLSYVSKDPVFSFGRIELLHYLQEFALSVDYHRYGNLGIREFEKKAPSYVHKN